MSSLPGNLLTLADVEAGRLVKIHAVFRTEMGANCAHEHLREGLVLRVRYSDESGVLVTLNGRDVSIALPCARYVQVEAVEETA